MSRWASAPRCDLVQLRHPRTGNCYSVTFTIATKPPGLRAVIRHMVEDMAVQQPLSWPVSREFNVVTLAGRHEDRIFCELRSLRYRVSVRPHNFEGEAMQMHADARTGKCPSIECAHGRRPNIIVSVAGNALPLIVK